MNSGFIYNLMRFYLIYVQYFIETFMLMCFAQFSCVSAILVWPVNCPSPKFLLLFWPSPPTGFDMFPQKLLNAWSFTIYISKKGLKRKLYALFSQLFGWTYSSCMYWKNHGHWRIVPDFLHFSINSLSSTRNVKMSSSPRPGASKIGSLICLVGSTLCTQPYFVTFVHHATSWTI